MHTNRGFASLPTRLSTGLTEFCSEHSPRPIKPKGKNEASPSAYRILSGGLVAQKQELLLSAEIARQCSNIVIARPRSKREALLPKLRHGMNAPLQRQGFAPPFRLTSSQIRGFDPRPDVLRGFAPVSQKFPEDLQYRCWNLTVDGIARQ